MISIGDLMQITHPGHRHYSTEVSLHDSDLPLFLDYCVNVIQRFNHHHYETYQNNLDNIDCIIKIVDFYNVEFNVSFFNKDFKRLIEMIPIRLKLPFYQMYVMKMKHLYKTSQ